MFGIKHPAIAGNVATEALTGALGPVRRGREMSPPPGRGSAGAGVLPKSWGRGVWWGEARLRSGAEVCGWEPAPCVSLCAAAAGPELQPGGQGLNPPWPGGRFLREAPGEPTPCLSWLLQAPAFLGLWPHRLVWAGLLAPRAPPPPPPPPRTLVTTRTRPGIQDCHPFRALKCGDGRR